MKATMRFALLVLLATAVIVQASVPDAAVPAVVDSSNIESVFAAVDAAQSKPTPTVEPTIAPAPVPLEEPASQPQAAFVDAELASEEDPSLLPGTREGAGEPEVLEGSIMPAGSEEDDGEQGTDAPQTLEATIGEASDLAPDVVPSQDDDVQVIDFGGSEGEQQLRAPTAEELSEVRSRVSSALRGFLSSFFGGDEGELNASPSEQQQEGEVRTETREIPGGFVVVRSFRTPEGGEVTEQEAHQSFGAPDASPMIEPMPSDLPADMPFFDLPPPPPMPLASLFERFFGPPRGEPERSLFGTEESSALLAGQRPGCRKHRSGLLGRLHSLLSDDFAPLRRVPAFVGHHDEPEGWDRLMAGPFVRVDFAGAETEGEQSQAFVEAEEVPGAEEAAPAEELVAPTPEEQAQAEADGFVAPHTYEVDYRAGEATTEYRPLDGVPVPQIEPMPLIDPPMDDMAVEEEHHYRHRGWFRHHRALVLALAGVLALGLAGFAVFLCRRRKRLLAAAHVKQTTFALPTAPVELVAAQPVQAFAVEAAPVHSNGYRLLQA